MNDMNLKLVDSDEEEKNEKPKRENNELKNKMIKYAIFIIIGVVILLFALFIFSVVFPSKKSYEQVEQIMKNAAEKYYSDHKNRLPGDNTKNAGIEVNTLVSNEYMDELSKYLGDDTKCNSGRVTVEKINKRFVYTPYLYCGDEYETSELYKKVTDKKNVVVNGDGVYFMNNEYVYRGTNVKNYVLIDNFLWRIVKVDSNNEILLIRNDNDDTQPVAWDDRYNNLSSYTSGVNDFSISRIRDSLKKYYQSDKSIYFGNSKLITDNLKEHMVPFDLCYGKRADDYVVNNNSAECGQKLKNQMIGLLTLSDYLNASTDSECISPLAKNCQNYNYLRNQNFDWWLITADANDTASVYRVSSSGYIEKNIAIYMSIIRPTIKLSSRTMYKSGNGSEKKPYIIR